MLELKKRLSGAIKGVLDEMNPEHGLTEEDVVSFFEYPPDSKMGDLAFPCFKLSKVMRRAPAAIAAELKDRLSLDCIDKIEPAGGYLNFFISDAYLSRDVLGRVLEMKESYGSSDVGEGKTVVFDYSSPNVAKPFHIGHLGTTVIGHSLKKLHEFAGYRCVGINHLGDWGTQFGKMIVAFKRWGDRQLIEEKGIDELVALYVRFHAEAEKDESLNDEARAEFTKLEQGDGEDRALWKWFIEISIAEYKKTYRQLDIEFDSYCGESFYYDKLPAVIDELKAKGLLKLDEGASVVDLGEYGMPPCLILKSDGSSLYPARDIAAAIYRKQTYDFDKCVYVTDAGQHLHFMQFFKVLELMGYDWAKGLVHVPYGKVSINGAKLATRTGNVILLKDLFAQAIDKVEKIMDEKNPDLPDKHEKAVEIGVGAVVFYYLTNNRIKDINFVLEDALNFDGNTGPYAQYTYARTCSLLEKGAEYLKGEVGDYTPNEREREVLKALAVFPERVLGALEEYEPSVITRYILDLCAAYNVFYHDCKILTAESEDARAFRMRLSQATSFALGNAFGLICMKKTQKI